MPPALIDGLRMANERCDLATYSGFCMKSDVIRIPFSVEDVPCASIGHPFLLQSIARGMRNIV